MNKFIIIGTAAVGVLMFIIGAVMHWGVVPSIIRNKVADEFYLRNPSEAYDRFVKLAIPVQWSMYFFHIKNPEAFDNSNRSDVRVLQFTEMGPYVYDEYREKIQVAFGADGNNVSYVEKKSYKFNADLSKQGLNPTDKVTVVQAAFGLVSTYFPLAASMNKYDSIATTETVENIAFKGIKKLLDQSLFGPIENNLDKETTIDTGKKNIDQLGQYLKFDKDVGRQKVWHDNGTCNDLKGTDGTQFKPDLSSSDILYAFEPMLCKSIKFINNEKVTKSVTVQGIDTIRFYASDDNFARIPENACHCFEDSLDDCPGDLMNLRNCGSAKDVMNMLASSPYFQPVPELLKNTSIIPPKSLSIENYGTFIDIEPITGLVLSAKKRVQLNVQLRRELTPFLGNLKDKLAFIPLAWIEEGAEIDKEDAQKLKDQAINPKQLAAHLLIALMAAGGLLMLIAGGCAVYNR